MTPAIPPQKQLLEFVSKLQEAELTAHKAKHTVRDGLKPGATRRNWEVGAEGRVVTMHCYRGGAKQLSRKRGKPRPQVSLTAIDWPARIHQYLSQGTQLANQVLAIAPHHGSCTRASQPRLQTDINKL